MRTIAAVSVSVLLWATVAGQQDQSNYSAPFPQATYEGAESPNPATKEPADFSPPYYPSPWASGKSDWGPAYQKARAFVGQLTLLEKVNLTTGIG